MDELVWHPFEVDGEELFWTCYSSTARSKTKGSEEWGPEEAIELLSVSRDPNGRPSVARGFPVGTLVTEAHAAELARLMRRDGRTI